MTIKSDKWIKSKCVNLAEPMIEPFYPDSMSTDSHGRKIPSYGLSSFGYDMRLGRNFKLFKTHTSCNEDHSVTYCTTLPDGQQRVTTVPVDITTKIIDLHKSDYKAEIERPYMEFSGVDWIDLHPGGFVLAHTEEYTRVPRDVSVVCMGKSTIARLGIIVTVTPLEAGWEGITTLEITNTTRIPIRLYSGWGICQMQFVQSDEECEVSYADRGGKYQFQGKKPIDAKV